jgi:hypothetical protein
MIDYTKLEEFRIISDRDLLYWLESARREIEDLQIGLDPDMDEGGELEHPSFQFVRELNAHIAKIKGD